MSELCTASPGFIGGLWRSSHSRKQRSTLATTAGGNEMVLNTACYLCTFAQQLYRTFLRRCTLCGERAHRHIVAWICGA